MESKAVGVILSGAGADGVEGLEEISRVGGTTIVQEVTTSLAKEMPLAALSSLEPAYVIPDAEVSRNLNSLLDSG